MPGYLLHTNATAQCAHFAAVNIAPGQTRVQASDRFVATSNSALNVVGVCPFQVPVPGGTKPQPCITVRWSMVSTRVLADGKAVLLQPSLGTGPGICLSAEQIPQGPPMVSAMQLRAVEG